jgi:hypothetical protein
MVMSNFPIIATVLSMILGLSVTRLLLGSLTVFRIRRDAKVDWIPLVWAAILFTMQLDFWWAVNSLPSIKTTFTFPEFLLLVLLALSLFISAALLLPSRSEDEKDGLRIYFEQDGRFALLSISVYLIFGFIVNVVLFEASPWAPWGGLDLIMMLLPLIAFSFNSRRVYSVITLVYAPLSILDITVTLSN